MTCLEISFRIIACLAVLVLLCWIVGDVVRRPFPWFRRRSSVYCDSGSMHCASCSPGQGCGLCPQVATQLTPEPASEGVTVGESADVPEEGNLPAGMSESDYCRGSCWPDYMLEDGETEEVP